ncbi:uncharacterized protein PODANS_6_8335 [Podospora anserina S mat+]|uniref:Podospora anserina S mat+ genomic DNA chromosome 6, supercontig 4 n=1 Tax=Podospora anserina (strain S / ATCC MYA-4624 / DSM 980 / FGSC 10383) TaxID=515849 RepID=B2AMY0_PODAN|nr:uncharacterized protein PODANS_6_8335 [Podospora anserina S mat+]CAP65321.1 unnamed protein product [Podospora anserina S mat+]CDP31317.1 Putative protein of unknown function [Podospora anserina S mat+]
MNRFFIEIDKAVAKKQEEFDDVWRKELLHLVSVAFYNILVMSLWTLSFPLLTTHFHFFVTPVIYAFLYFVAHDLLGASWKTLWATICTIASKDSPLQRELTHLEKGLNDDREDWNVKKNSMTKTHAKLMVMVQQGMYCGELYGEMHSFGLQTSVWKYLPPRLSRLLFGDEETARFMDSVDFDWGALYK